MTQLGKFMGSTVSPDGRFLAATSTDRSVVAADLRPVELQAHLVGRHRVRRQPAAHQRHRRPGRPDVLAERQVPLASGADRPDPVPGQPRRHARHADHGHDPDGERPRRRWSARSRTRPTGRRCTPRSTGRTPSSRSTPTPARSSTRGTSASPRVSSRSSAASSTSATRAAVRRSPATTTMDSYGTAVPANGYLGTSTTGTVSVIDTANPTAAVGIDRRRPAPDRDVSPRASALFVANTNSDTVSVIDTDEGQGRADDRHQAVAVVGHRLRARPASR